MKTKKAKKRGQEKEALRERTIHKVPQNLNYGRRPRTRCGAETAACG